MSGRSAVAGLLADDLVQAWGSWGPTLSPDGSRVAFVSDRRGQPELWIQDGDGPPTVLGISADPVLSVHWSADGRWLAAALATNGGVRSQIWVLRPDGSDARRVAGSAEHHASLGPWARAGHHLVVSMPAAEAGNRTDCVLIDPATGTVAPLAKGDLLTALDLSSDERFVLLRDGTRGAQFCVMVDRPADRHFPLLPFPRIGSTDVGLLRHSPAGEELPMIAYLVTDAGLPRRVLLAQTIGPDGSRGPAGVLADRPDGELEYLDADEDGRLLLLVWNVAGASEAELFETATRRTWPLPPLPAPVVSGCVLSRDGSQVVLCLEGPYRPRELWATDTASILGDARGAEADLDNAEDRSGLGVDYQAQSTALTHRPAVPRFRRLVPSSFRPRSDLIEPSLETFEGHDGLPLTGWLYRARGWRAPGPAMLSLHGGPESQERPVFSAQHQTMASAGITVFAPNVRGSSGFGHAFVHADDRHGRHDAISDVRSSALFLADTGIADPDRIAVTGRSYGGYLTLAALVTYPGLFAAGVDICGMSDLLTFYRDSEPWIAAAAVSKYGDPVRDRDLLRELSPLARAHLITVPLLVVHGELDTNVPIGEAYQIVAALRDLGRPVEYLELPGEGHEYRRSSSRRTLLLRMLDFLTEHLQVPE